MWSAKSWVEGQTWRHFRDAKVSELSPSLFRHVVRKELGRGPDLEALQGCEGVGAIPVVVRPADRVPMRELQGHRHRRLGRRLLLFTLLLLRHLADQKWHLPGLPDGLA